MSDVHTSSPLAFDKARLTTRI